MPLAPPLSISLTQTKRFSGEAPYTERFVVQSKLVASRATVNSFEAAFILGPASGVDRERLLRVVDLKKPLDAALVSQTPSTNNPLRFFRDAVLNLAGLAFTNDILRVQLPPGEWSVDGSLPVIQDFLIEDVDGPNQRIKTVGTFLWSAQNLQYDVLAPDLVTSRLPPATPVLGRTERQLTSLIEWRSDQITLGFDTAPEALDHIASVQALVASYAQQLKVDIPEYLDVGGNPIVNTY